MFDFSRLEAVQQAAERNDWDAAGEAYIELSLQMRGTRDRFRIEVLAPYVRLRDAERVAAIARDLSAADHRPG
ncbi:MAG: hypothetical protein O2917_11265 [Acidobacteria bacterium]|nr:hypothetical protein [Acidobacteriota bacterium]MDA1307827.1 hypothetical protein [Acidobacteriota bacterium]